MMKYLLFSISAILLIGIMLIPDWIKNNAGWWADGTIDDGTFVNAIQYLIKEGLIQV